AATSERPVLQMIRGARETWECRLVARDDDRRMEVLAREFEGGQDRGAALRVERGRWLVREDHLGAVREGPGDGDPLRLAHGAFVRAAGRQSHEGEGLQQIADTRIGGLAGEAQRQLELLLAREVVEWVV